MMQDPQRPDFNQQIQTNKNSLQSAIIIEGVGARGLGHAFFPFSVAVFEGAWWGEGGS